MSDQFSRTRLLLGGEGIERLRQSRVAVFGLGGVGGYAVEALCRSGVGALELIDSDRVSLSNLNRQILATHATVGQYKTDAARSRVLAINPAAEVRVYNTFFTPETAGAFDFTRYDYVLDAIDTVTGKIELVCQAKRAGAPVISCMGAGNKMDPTALELADLFDTSVCPLARVMRKELRRRGIDSLKVVYSREPPLVPDGEGDAEEDASPRRQIPGSSAFVPAAAGLIMAGEVVRELSRWGKKK